jgi:TRAP-type transport system periplasmic protein
MRNTWIGAIVPRAFGATVPRAVGATVTPAVRAIAPSAVGMTAIRIVGAIALCAVGAIVALAQPAVAADAKHYSLGYDQPHTTGYGIGADLFAAKLAELSGGTMVIDQFPGAQLGQEPQMLQKIRTGDIDFIFSASANAATISPQSGVMSIHYLFRSEDHLVRAVADPRLVGAVRDMFADTVKDAHLLTVLTLGLRNLYGKKEIHSIDDVKNLKIRVQATPTEDAMFPAYGAQTVHMPFGSVYTSLQTGVVDMAENGINVYDTNKHYEVAPIMSLTGHEANINLLWISGKLWDSLTAEQKGWVDGAATEVATKEPALAVALEAKSRAKLEKLGVKFVPDVDKSGFIKVAQPLQDKIAADLGPHAVTILGICRSIQ